MASPGLPRQLSAEQYKEENVALRKQLEHIERENAKLRKLIPKEDVDRSGAEIMYQKQTALVVCIYWMRTSISEEMTSSEHTIDVMLDRVIGFYLGLLPFEWESSPKRREGTLRVIKDGKSVRTTSSSKMDWKSICSVNVISAEEHSLALWELTLKSHRKLDSPQDPFGLMIGYFNAAHVKTFLPGTRIGTVQHSVALHMSKNEYPRKYAQVIDEDISFREIGIASDCPSKMFRKYEPKIGDRFRLDFDFIKGRCKAYLNNEYIGLISENLPRKICLAVSVFEQSVSYETTLFEQY